MESGVGAGAMLTDLEPGRIPGGETPPSTAGGTPAATDGGTVARSWQSDPAVEVGDGRRRPVDDRAFKAINPQAG